MVDPTEPPSELLSFALQSCSTSDLGPRLGTLSFADRTPIATPHYIAVSSRGAVPHITQDTMRTSTSVRGIYAALEDFIEKAPQATPPVYNFPAPSGDSPLRRFIALQQDALLVLGPRRIPPVICPASNTHTAVSMCTSVGFHMLECEDYVESVRKLRPDVVLGLADVVYGPKPGWKRVEKMGNRTLLWLKEVVDGMNNEEAGTPRTSLFAPILAIESELQVNYLEQLQGDELRENVSGLVLYGVVSAAAIPASMHKLPRLSVSEIKSPQKLLDEIALGVDIFTIPFIGAATDAGIALHFSFPALTSSMADRTALPLGIDMWSPMHSTSLSPLQQGCACNTCTNHHRAYIQHLLSAKEMLGWVLLQIHNHSVLDAFFVAVRSSIASGSFDTDRSVFERSYEPELPAKTGQGPRYLFSSPLWLGHGREGEGLMMYRVRGYQFRSSGPGEPKKNPPAYRTLDDAAEKLAEAPLPSPRVDAGEPAEKIW